MTVDVVNSENQKVGSVELSDAVFGGRVKTDLIHASVVRANAAERRGTHATKTRAQVSGSGKKPWRQKGTGRARVGEIRNPLWRKGGTVFGPQPRSYAFTAPKKVELAGLGAALAQKAQDGDARHRRRAVARRGQDPRRGGDADARSGSRARRCWSTSSPTRSWRCRCATCRAWPSGRARVSPPATSSTRPRSC